MCRQIFLPLVFVAALAPDCAVSEPRIATRGNVVEERGVLWRDPGDIRLRNLYYGIGGKDHEPRGVMTFEKEDKAGSSPKFTVRDSNGVTWKVKLGIEARPEVAATRIVWAAGYVTDEDYFMPTLQVQNLPGHLRRGQKLRLPGGTFRDARLERKIPGLDSTSWKWKKNAFNGTRELNGLRVLMALINNWDVKDVNNTIYTSKKTASDKIYVVSDLGASFGSPGLRVPFSKSRGYLQAYQQSRFVTKVNAEFVDFAAPARPGLILMFSPVDFVKRTRYRWIGDRIPRDDAHWMGSLLARLSDGQIRDAFRSAGFAPGEVDGFTSVLRKRITELGAL